MRLEFEHLLWLLIGNENCLGSFGNNVRGGRVLRRPGAPLGRKARLWLLVFTLAFALALILGR